MQTNYTYQITQLRAKNLNMMMTAIAVMLAALFVSVMLPSLLISYVYASQQLMEAPLAYELIAPISFLIGIGYFLFAVVGNLLRAKRIKHLEMENILEVDCCGCGSCGCDDDLLSEMTSLAKTLEVKKPVKKKVAKSSKKKTSSKSKK